MKLQSYVLGLGWAVLLKVSVIATTDVSAAMESWAHEVSDLAPDEAVVWGQLENGVRYAVKPHGDPPGRVSLRLYVDAGSLMEEEDQRGLAHFTEHMAFNGTTHFPAGEMVEYFQRLGMAFGADTNAHTSYKETVYKLELPRTDEALLKESFQLLRDYADGIQFGDEELEKERGVILSEKLSRDSVEYRTYINRIKFALPESLVSERSPIGTEEVISGAPRERFLDFYRRYYTPDRMVVVAVGDVDPEEIVGLIEEYFGTMDAPDETVGDPDLGRVAERGVVARLQAEPESSYTWVDIQSMEPYAKGADREETRLEELKVELAERMLNRRFEILAKKDGAEFLQGQTFSYDMFDFVTVAGLRLAAKHGTWEGALETGEQELRRALEYGFTEAELTEAKANIAQKYARAAETASTRKSRELADRLVNSFGEERVFTAPEQNRAFVEGHLEEITADEVLTAFRSIWSEDDLMVFVSGQVDEAVGDAGVLAAFEASRGAGVEAPVEEEAKAFAYAAAAEAGEVAEREAVEDLGVTQVRFANGVRLNLKETDFEDETVRVTVRVGAGRLTQPKDLPGLATFLEAAFELGGLEEHSLDEIKRIFAGTTVGLQFGVADDAFVFSGRVKPEDLMAELELMAAYLTAPGYRSEAEGQFRRQVSGYYQQLKHTSMGVMQNEVSKFIHGDDPRFGYPSEEEMMSRSFEEAKGWLSEALGSGYLEISVVGEIEDEEAVIEMVGRTFGRLDEREGEKPAYVEERVVDFPEGAEDQQYDYSSEIAKGLLLVYWKTADMSDIERTRRLSLLSSVFRDRLRLKIREELGEAYSPYARNTSSDAYEGYGYLFATVESEPANLPGLAEIIEGISEDFRENGVTEDELERAKEPLLNQLAELRRNNSYWMDSVLQSSQERPERLEWARTIVPDFEGVTAAELSALAKEYLGADRAVVVTVVPEEGTEG
ncbi:MAG: insulinase family protein [Verrucomicrobiota bacterium]